MYYLNDLYYILLFRRFLKRHTFDWLKPHTFKGCRTLNRIPTIGTR
jgi:hypothetical protein